jgi:hypothetical protein
MIPLPGITLSPLSTIREFGTRVSRDGLGFQKLRIWLRKEQY